MRGDETLTSSGGILKRHDILINLIPSQKMYGQTIEEGNNIVHGIIGTTIYCNIGLVSLGVNMFL